MLALLWDTEQPSRWTQLQTQLTLLLDVILRLSGLGFVVGDPSDNGGLRRRPAPYAQLPLQELLGLLVLWREVQLWEGLDRVDLLGDGFIFQESFFIFALEEMQEVVMARAGMAVFRGTGQVRLASRALGRMLCPPSFLRINLSPFCRGKTPRRQRGQQPSIAST